MSADKPEEKKEQAEAKKSPEAPAKEAVIGATPQQDRWKLMEQAHYLGLDESATDLFKPGERGNGDNKFCIEGLEDEPPVKVAQKFPEIKLKLELDQNTKDTLSCFIYRGKEDEQMDYGACANAYKAFPEFARHPEVDKALLPAIIRNELHFYSLWKDSTADGIAGVLGQVPGRPQTSLGVGQIQEQHLPRLMKEFPQLKEKAEITDPVKAVLDKHKVPWLVAAYLADSVRTLEKANQPVTNRALMLLYNPGGQEHIKNVTTQIEWIKKNHPEI